jgi:hypothetical protein
MIIHIIFVGLISFFQDGNSVRALLLNAIGPQRASDAVEIPRHLAFVAVKKRVADDPNCPDEADLNHGLSKPIFCSWLLRHDDVTLEGQVTGDSSQGPLCDPRATNCPAVLKDKNLIPEHLVLKGECLEPKPIGCPVAGRMLVPSRKIEGTSFCEDDIKFYPLRGRSEEAMNGGKVADVAWAEVTSQADFLKLHIDKFDSLMRGRTIKVWLNRNIPVNIFVGNISQIHHEECSMSCTVGTDHHFEMYYGLSEQPPGAYRRPVPHACCRCGFIPDIPCWLRTVLEEIGVLPSAQVGLETTKGLNERIICPMSSF